MITGVRDKVKNKDLTPSPGFGNITFSAVTKTASRLSIRMKEDRTMRKEVDVMEKKLSSVKG